MESERRRNRRWLMTGVALLVAAWSFIALLIFQTSSWLDYLRRHAAALGETDGLQRLRYPMEAVASSAALILAEAAILWAILTQVKKPFWIRTGATSLALLVAVVVGVLSWHTDSAPHEESQTMWLFFMSGVFAVLCLGSGIARIVKRLRRDH